MKQFLELVSVFKEEGRDLYYVSIEQDRLKNFQNLFACTVQKVLFLFNMLLKSSYGAPNPFKIV